MRLVLDTNVVASGILWHGTPGQLLDAARTGDIEVFTSRHLLAELTRILQRAKFTDAIAASGLSLDDLFSVTPNSPLWSSLSLFHPPSLPIPMTIMSLHARSRPKPRSSCPETGTC